MMSKRLYTGFSFFQFILYIFFRLCLVFAIITSLSHYYENPVLISIVAAVSFLLLLVLGDDQIIIYEDRIVQTTNSFLSLGLGNDDTTYLIADIKAARLKPPPTKSLVDDLAAVALSFILPKPTTNRNKTEPIFFDLKSGKTMQLNTNLDDCQVKRIVELVNALVAQ